MPNDTSGSSTPNGSGYTDIRPSRNAFAGHLGHLTKEQEEAFSTFKEILVAAKLYTPATEVSPASHDDSTLLYVPEFPSTSACWVLTFTIHIQQSISSCAQLPTCTSSEAVHRHRGLAEAA